jgi:hypothetical protein
VGANLLHKGGLWRYPVIFRSGSSVLAVSFTLVGWGFNAQVV